MKFPKVPLLPALKQKVPVVAFVLIIPLGILVGFFFSNIKTLVSGGYKGVSTSVNKALYVAKVDGVGISKSEWKKFLQTRYGLSAAQDLISLYTIKGALKKEGVVISKEEVDTELATVESQLNGESLEDLLKQQGRTLSDFRDDISLQLGMKKLLQDKITITNEELTDYIATYGSTMEGYTDEQKTAAAKSALMDQKLGEEAGKWYMQVQGSVKVDSYLN